MIQRVERGEPIQKWVPTYRLYELCALARERLPDPPPPLRPPIAPGYLRPPEGRVLKEVIVRKIPSAMKDEEDGELGRSIASTRAQREESSSKRSKRFRLRSAIELDSSWKRMARQDPPRNKSNPGRIQSAIMREIARGPGSGEGRLKNRGRE